MYFVESSVGGVLSVLETTPTADCQTARALSPFILQEKSSIDKAKRISLDRKRRYHLQFGKEIRQAVVDFE
jgi:hypothetical protein